MTADEKYKQAYSQELLSPFFFDIPSSFIVLAFSILASKNFFSKLFTGNFWFFQFILPNSKSNLEG